MKWKMEAEIPQKIQSLYEMEKKRIINSSNNPELV
jgi:hypothetical protein